MRGVLLATTILLLSGGEVLRAQTPADTLALARGTAVAIASSTSPPRLRADTVVLEPGSGWGALVVEELRPRMGDTGTVEGGPYWERLSSLDLRFAGDSAIVSVEVDECSRRVHPIDSTKTHYHAYVYGYFFRREWYGWELDRVLPFGAGDGSCDPGVPPHEHGLFPRLAHVESDVAPRLMNGDEVRSLLGQLYPDSLKLKGVGGRVVLWVRVSESGTVIETKTQTPSGNDVLDEAAKEIAAAMRFAPAENEGDPVSVWIAQPIDFRPGN